MGAAAALRDRLLGEIADIASADLAANWARGVLTAKDSLTAAKDAFEQRLLRFSGSTESAITPMALTRVFLLLALAPPEAGLKVPNHSRPWPLEG
jgi:hypothetical protein